MKTISPCYKCEDRQIGCHGTCEKYKGYKEEMKRLKEKETKINGYRHYRVELAKRRK